MSLHLRFCASALGFLMPAILHAGTYQVGGATFELKAPEGFFSLREYSQADFQKFFASANPNELDFFCYKDAPKEVGACNYHRTLTMSSERQLAGVNVDLRMFAAMKERLGRACAECEAKEASRPGVLKVQSGTPFSITDRTWGTSFFRTFTDRADHTSVESWLYVLVDGKVLMLDAKSDVKSPNDVEWTKTLLNEWSRSLLALPAEARATAPPAAASVPGAK